MSERDPGEEKGPGNPSVNAAPEDPAEAHGEPSEASTPEAVPASPPASAPKPPEPPRGPLARQAAREAARAEGNSLSWVHTFRVSPLALLLFLAVMAGLWILFDRTDLWYRLFP